MMNVLVDVLAALAGIAVALAGCVFLIRHGYISRRHSGAVVAGAMLLGLGYIFAGARQETVQESKDEANRKKDAQSGDPPDPVI